MAPSPESLVGSYRRYPTDEDHHRAKITLADGKLTWSNEAGQAWPVRLQETSLLIDESCPHYADGVRSMAIDMEGSVVVGIEFMGDMYALQEEGSGMVLVGMPNMEEKLEGMYERQPVEKDIHSVRLDYDDGVLKWSNNAGASWVLTVSDDKTTIVIGEDCPFYSEGGTSATIKEEDGNILGIEFMGEMYTKTNVYGEDESEGAICNDGPDAVFGPEDELSTDSA